MARVTQISETCRQIGSDIRIESGHLIERGEPTIPGDPNSGPVIAEHRSWHVYKKTDVTADEGTTETERWDEVDVFPSEPGDDGKDPGEKKALDRAQALAATE